MSCNKKECLLAYPDKGTEEGPCKCIQGLTPNQLNAFTSAILKRDSRIQDLELKLNKSRQAFVDAARNGMALNE